MRVVVEWTVELEEVLHVRQQLELSVSLVPLGRLHAEYSLRCISLVRLYFLLLLFLLAGVHGRRHVNLILHIGISAKKGPHIERRLLQRYFSLLEARLNLLLAQIEAWFVRTIFDGLAVVALVLLIAQQTLRQGHELVLDERLG